MALLELLLENYAGPVAAAHLEHGFRARASLDDAEFVRAYCEGRGVECYVRHLDVMSWRGKGESAEMAGRRARYEFFFETLEACGASFIATGHTADDTVETMLLNFFRGTGLKGLSGIEERRGPIIRPIIDCRREELRQYLRERGISWREDETNGENHYRRNKIRNQLLPWVRENLNESADRALLGLASDCRTVSERMEREAEAHIAEISANDASSLASWDIKAARRMDEWDLSNALRLQGERLSLPVLDRKRLNELCRLVKKSGRWRFQWAGDVEVHALDGVIRWVTRTNAGKILGAESDHL